MMKKKINIGDVFEIKTNRGYAYFQYVYNHESLGEYIKVFYQIHKFKPIDFKEIVTDKNFFLINFALKEAIKLNIVQKVENISISSEFEFPTHFREEHLFKENCWQIIDSKTWERKTVENLSEEQKKLSPWGSWNDTLLIENLENGWRLENWD